MSKLKEVQIKNIKGTGKTQKLYDGGGLYLYVSASGGKAWRIDFRYNGLFQTFTLGKYPLLTLTQARLQREEIKLKLAQGINPIEEKKNEKKELLAIEANKFQNVAELWIKHKNDDKTPKYRQDVRSKLERFVYPSVYDVDITTITGKNVLDVLRKLEARGIHETCKKTLGICNQIFSFAIGEGIVPYNICSSLSKQLKAVKRTNFAHITEKKELGEFLSKADNYPHGALVKIALQMAPYVFLRPSELVEASWSEINFDEDIWVIPEERMKVRKKHMVPLSKQVVKLLKELHAITGETKYLFANWSSRKKPITTDGVRQGIRRLGYPTLTTHGFRHTASTMLNELGYNSDWIEKQLAHTSANSVRGIYNHAIYLQDRKRMMQEWADFLDKLKADYNKGA